MKNKFIPLFVAVALIGLAFAEARSENIVSNGGFETPTISSNSFQTYSNGQTFGNWTVSLNSIDLVRMWQNAEGSQSLDMGGSPGPGEIYQDLATTMGQKYALRFAMAGDPYWVGIKEMKVYWSGSLVDDITFDTTGYTDQNMGWQYHEYQLVATSSTTRLQFLDINHTDGYYGTALDDVSVAPVPEPSSLILICAATFSFFPFILRRLK
jgi:choice-of-anchor C domain-containing protein